MVFWRIKKLRENVIEKRLVKRVKEMGGMAIKFQSANLNGVPDRIIILPGGYLSFVELKAPGKKMRPLQEKRKRQLEALGMKVFCIDSLEGIEVMLHGLCTV